MIWIIRLQHLFYGFALSVAAFYAITLFTKWGEFLGFQAWFWAVAVFGGSMIYSWVLLRLYFPDHKAIDTNRHAFNAIRQITENIPSIVKPSIGVGLGALFGIRSGTNLGLGGSSKFGILFEHWAHFYNSEKGDIFLGCSPWDHKSFFGQNDDKSGITLSEPRNGKGTTFIIPNLKLYPGSALILDGKNGENADATGNDRSRYGKVLCVDPYGVSEYGQRNGIVRFNPLSDLDHRSRTIIDEIEILSDSLVVKTGDAKADHFLEGAENLIKGLIAHMISTQSNPTLPDLRKMVMRVYNGDHQLLDEMAKNPACGNIIQDTATQFLETTAEVRNFLSSAKKSTEWLAKDVMKEFFSASDFSFDDLKLHKGTSIYLVLDANTLSTNAPFLRLFVNLALRSMRKGNKPQTPVLFLLDEFYSLGRMEKLSDSISEIPGYGVKMWPVMHNIGQLQELYAKNWISFLGGTQVYFGLSLETAQYVESELGQRGLVRTGKRDDRISTGLLSAAEIRNITSNDPKDGGNQIVIRSDGPNLLLRRVPYYTSQFKEQFVSVAGGSTSAPVRRAKTRKVPQ